MKKNDRLREKLELKQKEITDLIQHYKNGIINVEAEILKEKQEKHITSYSQAIKNKKIELDLYTIQRRKAYIKKLKQPRQQLQYAIEELLFTKREALIDSQMIDLSNDINMKKIVNQIDSIIKNYENMDKDFSIDKKNLDFQQISLIWKAINLNEINSRNRGVISSKSNNLIWQKICGGNFGMVNKLTELSPEAALCLSKWKGKDLYLGGLNSLSAITAKNIVSWKGEWLCLNGLRTLSPEAAKYLSQWEGKRLSLNGISELSGDTAKQLSNWHGKHLELLGINKISPQVADFLTQWLRNGGNIYINKKFREN